MEVEYYSVPNDEKETVILIDYYDKHIKVYSSRIATIKKLAKYLEKEPETETINGRVCSGEWIISFEDRDDIKRALSLGVLIPNKKSVSE